MTTVRDHLRDADPMRASLPRPDERARIRQRVLTESRTADRSVPFVRRRTVLVVGTLAVAGAAVGTQIWPRGGTTLQAAVRFEARLAETEPARGLSATTIAGGTGSTYVRQDVIVSNADVANARVVPGEDPDHFGVIVEFTAAGAQKMREATASHLGRPIAILIDGQVAAAPILRSPIDTTAVISGDYTQANAERIASGITR